MDEEIRKKLGEYYDSLYSKVYQVRDIFVDYYGEDFVDLQISPLNMNFLGQITLRTVATDVITVDDVVTASSSSGRYVCSKELWDSQVDDVLSNCFSPDMFNLAKWVIKQNILDTADIFPPQIYIRFPEVTVTNEHNNSINITELYVKVQVTLQGKLGRDMEMARSEFTKSQWASDYSHSHLPGRGPGFTTPCFGRGPIVSTQSYLKSNSFNEHMWGLYCLEIDKYTQVESLTGVPYRRLESVGSVRQHIERDCPPTHSEPAPFCERFPRFLRHFLSTYDFKLTYALGNYILGESFESFWKNLSRCFISWYNGEYAARRETEDIERLLSLGYITKYILKGDFVYGFNNSDVRFPEGSVLFRFKGEDVKLHVIDDGGTDVHYNYLVNKGIVLYIVSRILEIFNYEYKNNTEDSYDDGEENLGPRKGRKVL